MIWSVGMGVSWALLAFVSVLILWARVEARE
jgi:hypothetical protein